MAQILERLQLKGMIVQSYTGILKVTSWRRNCIECVRKGIVDGDFIIHRIILPTRSYNTKIFY